MHTYLNKTIVVTVNFFNGKGRLLEQYQTSGRISTIHNDLVVIERKGEENFLLPFKYKSMGDAEPGVYTVGTTGVELVNPDFTAQWIVNGIDEEIIKEYKRIGFQQPKE